MRAYQPSSDRAWSLDAKREARRRGPRKAPAEQPAAPPRVVEIMCGACQVANHHLCRGHWPTVPAALLRLGDDYGMPQPASCVCWCWRERDLS